MSEIGEGNPACVLTLHKSQCLAAKRFIRYVPGTQITFWSLYQSAKLYSFIFFVQLAIMGYQYIGTVFIQ